MKKQSLILSATLIFSTQAWAQGTDQDSVKYSTDVPQTISVDSPADPSVTGANELAWVKWVVSSNNAFKYSFSGTSKADDGADLPYPRFHKQDVDASGNLVVNNYDHLDTHSTVFLNNYGSVQFGDTWNTQGDISKLVAPMTDPASPYATTGRVMPGDDTSTAAVNLAIRGEADAFDQSGLYDMEIMITVTADEQEI